MRVLSEMCTVVNKQSGQSDGDTQSWKETVVKIIVINIGTHRFHRVVKRYSRENKGDSLS